MALWNVNSQTTNMQLETVRHETMTRVLLEHAGIPQQLIDQKLAEATARARNSGLAPRIGNPPSRGSTDTSSLPRSDTRSDAGEKTDERMDEDNEMPDEAADLAPFSKLTVGTMAKVLGEQGIETENLPKSKKQMAYSLSWALPNGLPVVVPEHEWPDKHKHPTARCARVVGLAGGQLVWSWGDLQKMDPGIPISALNTVPVDQENMYVTTK